MLDTQTAANTPAFATYADHGSPQAGFWWGTNPADISTDNTKLVERVELDEAAGLLTFIAFDGSVVAVQPAANPFWFCRECPGFEYWENRKATSNLASCGHPADEDGECSCSWWPERAPAAAAPAAEIYPVFDSCNLLTRDQVADLFKRAAQVIRDGGWTAYPDYEGTEGHDIRGALREAAVQFIWVTYARAPRDGEARDFADELEARLAGVLLMAGTSRRSSTNTNSVYDFETELVRDWRTAQSQHRTEADVIALLTLAAQVVCLTW